ncbi:MAG: hypothetical protein AABM30_06040 [Actinomycetota bacterium]
MSEAQAHAKINLALVVGPRRSPGAHQVATVLQRIDLADHISLEPAARLDVGGFPGDTLVRNALEAIAHRAGIAPCWSVRIEKRLPVAAGLGGGSSDAATALRLANETLQQPLRRTELHKLAHSMGVDIPFFLREGPQLGRGDGAALSRLALPQDYWVLVVLPAGAKKVSTKAVYDAFDRRSGERGFAERRAMLRTSLAEVATSLDLAKLPPNDLASSPVADELRGLGAFRADVTGAGPAVYALFADRDRAEAARLAVAPRGRTWLTRPAW